MKGYVHNIEKAADQNKTFRTVLYTAKNCQLVVMSLKPGEDIGAEVHKLDQFFRVEEGEGKAVLDGIEHHIKPGFAVLVPAGTRHNIINGPAGPMKLYTLYAPPNHRDGVVHATKADAEADKEHFDGKTTQYHRPHMRSESPPLFLFEQIPDFGEKLHLWCWFRGRCRRLFPL